ncbi:MAG: DUF2892 domain-containing protein [Gammaproteobacteria bacterium]|nr:DUF2892 domain-containing protein [Gammaproteobacteria bacterium]MDX5374274.1 DUF2892 domain-containing protein [Gammaproteobacteria bacterium]
MTINMGSIDRIIRGIVGIVLLALIVVFPEATWRWWGLIGIVPLATAIIGWCPAYTIFGMNTCAKRD